MTQTTATPISSSPTAQNCAVGSQPILHGCYYQVHEDVTHRLYQLRGTLKVLCGIAGTASMKDKTDSPECTIEQLHEMFWLLEDNVEQLIADITKTAFLFHNNERMI